MAELVMTDYLDMLKRSRLFESPEQLQECFDTWSKLETTTDTANTHSFADWLIQNNYITQWQSENIFAGKYKGFFLGKYKLLRAIGSGGMSSVYLAVHTILERQVAIKVLPKSRVTSDSSYLERFLLEAQAVAALDHPNIVRAYDVDTEGNSIYYLVMEYINGQDLLSLVKKEGPLDVYRAAKYLRQAAQGLHHAHGAGLIHRDMKPANLLVDKDDVIHVLDLGLARFTDEKRSSLTLTYDENVLGTADYLAPEQARNSHTVDARADIYGLGCTLYYLLTGHVPFPDGTLAQRIAAHQKRMPARIQDERPEVPDSLAEICWKMMAKDPNDRQQTAEEVADDLTRFLLEEGQKVEGFTGSLASLQKKKEESNEKKAGELQLEALKDLNSLANIANLANIGTSPKEAVSLSASASPKSVHNSREKNPSLENAKRTFLGAVDHFKKLIDGCKKKAVEEKETSKSDSAKIPSKGKTSKLSFDSLDSNFVIPGISETDVSDSLFSFAESLEKKDLEKKSTNDFQPEKSETVPEQPAEVERKLEVSSTVELGEKTEIHTESKAENTEKPSQSLPTPSDSNLLPSQSEPFSGLNFIVAGPQDSSLVNIEKSSVRKGSSISSASSVKAGSSIKAGSSVKAATSPANPGSSVVAAKPAMEDPMAFLSQSTSVSASNSDGSTHNMALDFGKSAAKKNLGVSDSKSSVNRQVVQGSSVLKKSVVGGSTALHSSKSPSTGPASNTAANKKAQKKKNERLLYAYIALGFFVVLLIIALISSF